MLKSLTKIRLFPLSSGIKASIGISIVAFIVYLPTVQYQFVWDDYVNFSRPYYRDIAFIIPAITQALHHTVDYYRPLPLASFIIESTLFGFDAAHMHLVSITLHAMNTFLVAFCALRLVAYQGIESYHWRWALLAGSLYGLHPALIEPVAFISSRFDLMLTLFLLLALAADLSISSRTIRGVVVGVSFLFAALCKEMAIGLVFVLPIIHYLKQQNQKNWMEDWVNVLRANIGTYVSLLFFGILYLILRYQALGYLLAPTPIGEIKTGTALQHLLLVGRTLSEYILIIIYPFNNLGPLHYLSMPVDSSTVSLWLHSIFAFCVLFVILIYALMRKSAALLLFSVFMTLLPVLNIRPLPRPGGMFAAESYLSFPLALVALAATLFIASSLEKSREIKSQHSKLVAIILFIWLGLSIITIKSTLPLWKNEIALWGYVSHRIPEAAMGHANLADAYLKLGQFSIALKSANRALEIDPNELAALSTGARALSALGKHELAIRKYKRIVDQAPYWTPYWIHYSDILNKAGRHQDALEAAQHAKILDPLLYNVHLNIAIAYLGLGEIRNALVAMNRALEIVPTDKEREWLTDLKREIETVIKNHKQ